MSTAPEAFVEEKQVAAVQMHMGDSKPASMEASNTGTPPNATCQGTIPPSPPSIHRKLIPHTDTGCPTTTTTSTFKSLSFLDRFLALWIFLSMALGILLGIFVPATPRALQHGEFANVSIPIAVGLLVMMYPILCKVQYETLHLILRERALWAHFAFSVVVNWVVAPLFMVCAFWAVGVRWWRAN